MTSRTIFQHPRIPFFPRQCFQLQKPYTLQNGFFFTAGIRVSTSGVHLRFLRPRLLQVSLLSSPHSRSHCRCGQTLFKNPKMEDLMSLKLMSPGTYTNQLEASAQDNSMIQIVGITPCAS